MIRYIGLTAHNNKLLLYYCQGENGNTFFKVIGSQDGFVFDNESQYVFMFDKSQKEEQSFDFINVRISKVGDEYFMAYQDKISASLLMSAFSTDLIRWQELGKVDTIKEPGVIVPEYRFEDKYVMYFGQGDIRVAYSEDARKWEKQETPLLSPRPGFFDDSELTIGNAYDTGEFIFLTYYVKKSATKFFVGAAYINKANPEEVVWRTDEPMWEQPRELSNDEMSPLGAVIMHGEVILYWSLKDTTLFAVSCLLPVPHPNGTKQVFFDLINKHKENPMIAPRPHVPWESRATFNSAAIYEDGKVHFLYRALGDTDLSVLGYANSSDGIHVDHRGSEPAYFPREPFETPGNHAFSSIAQHFVSGGGYGGIEDPRITRVEDKIYLTYVAFDGATPPRAAISSISIKDFVENNWGAWAKPKLISAPGMVNKSAVVMPRKINEKYVVLHRVYPNILVDFLDDLEFDNYLVGHSFIPPRKNFWDSKKVGAGAPPMETKDGWLLIYQSVGYQDSGRYKIGAMMLDRDNPAKVLYRTHTPIIEPVEAYENNGFKAGVVYPCGAVIMNDTLYIYYGGADSYVNVAWADMNTFLDEMKHHREPQLRKVTGQIFA